MTAVTVTLAGDDYQVPKMNLGQLEEVTVAFDLPAARRPFAILKIAMLRAEPKITDIGGIEAGNDEIATAVRTILANSGFKAADPNPASPAPAPGAES